MSVDWDSLGVTTIPVSVFDSKALANAICGTIFCFALALEPPIAICTLLKIGYNLLGALQLLLLKQEGVGRRRSHHASRAEPCAA